MVLDNMALLVNKNKTKQQTNITIASTFARILFFFLIKGLAGVSAGANNKNEKKPNIHIT